MAEIIEAGSIELDREQPKVVDAGSIELDKPTAKGPTIQSWEGPSFMDRVFGLFDDPEKESAKAVQALVDSQALGISPSAAYRYRDQIDQGVKINPQAAMKRSTLTQRVKQSFDTGVKQNQVGELGYQYIMTGDPKYLDAINKVGMPGESDTFIPEGRVESAIRSAAKMLPMMADTAVESTGAGLTMGMAFGGTAAILGQLGPQAALPEEIATVPAATLTGFTIGATAKAFESSLRKEAGLALSEIITFKDKDGKQIDPNIARAASFGIGVINGAIEVSQVKMLVKTIPGLDKLVSRALIETVASKTVKDQLVKLSAAYAGTVAKETAQEVAQESTNIVFEELAKKVNNNLKGTNLDPAKVDEVVKRLHDTALESAQAFSVFTAPGNVVRAGMAVMPERQAKTQQAGTQAAPAATQAPGLAGIATLESGGKYTAEHPATKAYGKYQIMPSNWGPWAKEAGLSADAPMTPENQETVANFKWNQYMERFGGNDQLAATAWFAGPGAAQRLMNGDTTVLSKSDANGTTVEQYIAKTTGREFGAEGTAQTAVNIDDVITRAIETDDDIDQIANDFFAGMVTEEGGQTEAITVTGYRKTIPGLNDKGETIWYSRDKDYAEAYGESFFKGRGELVEETVTLNNPLRVTLPNNQFTDEKHEKQYIEQAKKEGHDGVIFTQEDGEFEFYVALKGQKNVTTGQTDANLTALIMEKAKAINDTIGENGSIDLTPVVELGRSVYQQGARTYEQFSARVKELVGDAWEKVKDFVKQAFEIVKNERGSVTISSVSSKEGPGKTTKTSLEAKPEGGNPFKDSVVQEPVYHGSQDVFSEFSDKPSNTHAVGKATIGGSLLPDGPETRKAHWFIADKTQAANYANRSIQSRFLYPGSVLYKAYISLKNPLIIDMRKVALTPDAKQSAVGVKSGRIYQIHDYKEKALKEAKKNGNDGVIFKNGYDWKANEADIYAVLSPNQIKISAEPLISTKEKQIDLQTQDFTDLPNPSRSPGEGEQIASSIKAVLNDKGSVDLTNIIELGQSIWSEGATTLDSFTSRAKELLADVWDKVKDLVRQAWDVISNESGKITIEKGKKSGKINDATEQTSSETGAVATRSVQSKSEKEFADSVRQTENQAVTELKSLLAKAEKALASAQKKNKTTAIKKAQEKVQSVKARIREITGQTKGPKTVTEYDALKASFVKAARAAREAYRAGNKEGVEKAKAQMKEAYAKAQEKRQAKEQRAKDLKAIKKLSQMKGSIAVDYQKKIRDLMEGIDFKNISAAKWEQLKALQDFIESEGVPLGINPKRLSELKRLTAIPLKSLDNEQIAMLRKQLEELTALGKLKASLKYKYNERKRADLERKILETTRNLDPSVQFEKGELRRRDKMKVASVAMYLNTMHTPRVADLADGYNDYKGEQARLIKSAGEAETRAVANATKRQQGWLDFLRENKIELPTEGSESDIRMNIVIRMLEGATKPAEMLMKEYGVSEVPTLTDEENKIIEYIRQDMDRQKGKLAATWEEINEEIFPEQKVYYLPLKYVGEEELLPETQTEGRGRTTHTFDGFSHARRPNVNKLPRIGIAKLYQEATMEQEWFTGLQPIVEDIKSVVLTPAYKERAGSILYDWWKTQLDIMSRRGWTASAQMTALSSALATIRHNITTATLAFKLSTVIMQPMAVFDAMSYVNSYYGPVAAAKVAGAVAESFLRPGWTKGIVEGSEALKQRAAGELAIQEELSRLDDTVMDKVKRAGFNMIQWTDIKTAAGVQEQVRKILLAEGMNEDEALKEAEFVMHLSQGSTSVAYRPHILAQGEGYRTWFTFQNFFLNRWGVMIHDIVNGKIINGKGISARFLGMVSLGVLIAGGMAEDEARRKVRQIYTSPKEDKRSMFEQIIVNVLGAIPFFGSFVTAVSQKFDAQPPTISHVQKTIEGAFQTVKGKDTTSKVKGGLKLSEALATIFLGIPGTGQIFDLIESATKDDDRRNR